jgi:hypothetical protein
MLRDSSCSVIFSYHTRPGSPLTTMSRCAGAAHKDTLFSAIHLASLWKLHDQQDKALQLLTEALATAEGAYTARHASLLCGVKSR